MGLVALYPDRDAQPLAPYSLGQLGDMFFAAGEIAFALVGVEQEPLKITKVIEDKACNLSGESDAMFLGETGCRFAVAGRRGQDAPRARNFVIWLAISP